MAITKERLEELLDKNSVIFYINIFKDSYGNIVYKGNGTNSYSLDICDTHISDVGLVLDCDEHVDFNDLYEHEHDAIHASKYVNMEKAEKLSLPFWSEVESFKNSDAYNREYVLFAKLDEYDMAVRYVLVLTRRNAFGELIDTIDVRWEINDSEQPEYDVIFQKPLIKENYAEACEIIKKIWENK